MENTETKETKETLEKEPNAAPEAKEPAKEPKDKAKKEKKSELDALKEKLSSAEAALKEKENLYLRMAAEYDNFRRRSREEREAAYDSAVADCVSSILPILDNLERAAAFDDAEKVKEGLLMISGSVASALSSLRVEPFGAPGETFDPKLHSAVLHGEDPEKGEGEIVDVFQKGYKKGSKIIRCAMVKTVN